MNKFKEFQDKINNHYQLLQNKSISELFKDNNHVKNSTFELDDLYLDVSKNLFTTETLGLFIQHAEEINLKKQIGQMFAGEQINFTEKRAVLHTALRNPHCSLPQATEIKEAKQHFESFVNDFTNKKIKGYTGQDFTTIVNIGIGGSYLGTQMACNALNNEQNKDVPVYFISNVDAHNLVDILNKINPETTLFTIASKTFTTQETLLNANTVKQWFINKAGVDAVKKHFVALSTNIKAVKEFGITENWIFGFWDYIGGRYSIWSAIGLPLALKLGVNGFNEFLSGALLVDDHFQNTPLEKNIPFVLASISMWYNNMFNYDSYAILPYDYRLRDFSRYVQQLEMESNGKHITKNGTATGYNTSPLVFGEPGTDSQHSFYQMLHQGTKIIPCDFIGFIKAEHSHNSHQDVVIANLFAQSEALMTGKNEHEVMQELATSGLSNEDAQQLLPHKLFAGNRPSNTFLFKELSPKTLGMLCAIYEQKIFVQGVFWNINSFDQWGVELGKKLANSILEDITSSLIKNSTNESTVNLLKCYKKC